MTHSQDGERRWDVRGDGDGRPAEDEPTRAGAKRTGAEDEPTRAGARADQRGGRTGDEPTRAGDEPTGANDPADPDARGWEDVEDAGLAETTLVSCPYCAAPVELLIDPGGGPVQEYVEDCEVCCQPWSVRLKIAPDGAVMVSLGTQDEV